MKLLKRKGGAIVALLIGVVFFGPFAGYFTYTLANGGGVWEQSDHTVRCLDGNCCDTFNDSETFFIGSQTPSDKVQRVCAGDGDDQIFNSGQTPGDGSICSTNEGDDGVGTDLNGQGGDDFIVDNNDANTLRGGDGNDALFGNGGDDCIVGDSKGGDAPGDDLLSGGDGDDQFAEGPGNDTVIGGQGLDTYTAGAGDDVFVIFVGDVPVGQTETILCGDDNDTIVFVGFGTTNFTSPVTDPITGGQYEWGEDCEQIVGF